MYFEDNEDGREEDDMYFSTNSADKLRQAMKVEINKALDSLAEQEIDSGKE